MNLFVGLLVIAVVAWNRVCGDTRANDAVFFAGLTVIGLVWLLVVS